MYIDQNAQISSVQHESLIISRNDELSNVNDSFDLFMKSLENEYHSSDKDDKLIIESIENNTLFQSKKGDVKNRVAELSEEEDNDYYERYVQRLREIEQEDRKLNKLDEENNKGATKIDTLPFFDHSSQKYIPFEKDFLKLHPDIEFMSPEEINQLRTKLCITVTGLRVPRLMTTFEQMSLPDWINVTLDKKNFSEPTPVQSQCIPVILSGRDVLCEAPTGTGKSLSFIVPLLVHVVNQDIIYDGCQSLIITPTRELAIQHYCNIRSFIKNMPNKAIKCTYITSGFNGTEQLKSLKNGCNIIVANPGRLISILSNNKNILKDSFLSNITLLCLDEIDVLFNSGFEASVKSIIQNIRSDRQIVSFSASLNPSVDNFIKNICSFKNLVRIKCTQNSNQTNKLSFNNNNTNNNINQFGIVVENEEEKWEWLADNLQLLLLKNEELIRTSNQEMLGGNNILIFVNEKLRANKLCQYIQEFLLLKCVVLHSDLSATDRLNAINLIKSNKVQIMIASNIASRGIDLPSIGIVINYDSPTNFDIYIHRIGRCGRANQKGVSFTLLLPYDYKIASHIAENYQKTGKDIPDDLKKLAMINKTFRKKLTNKVTLDSFTFNTAPKRKNDISIAKPEVKRLKTQNELSFETNNTFKQIKQENNDAINNTKKYEYPLLINHSRGKVYQYTDVVSSDDEETYLKPTPFIPLKSSKKNPWLYLNNSQTNNADSTIDKLSISSVISHPVSTTSSNILTNLNIPQSNINISSSTLTTNSTNKLSSSYENYSTNVNFPMSYPSLSSYNQSVSASNIIQNKVDNNIINISSTNIEPIMNNSIYNKESIDSIAFRAKKMAVSIAEKLKSSTGTSLTYKDFHSLPPGM